MTVHLLTMDGEYSVHTTQRKAILHYTAIWASSRELYDVIMKRLEDAKLDTATKRFMKRALDGNCLPEEEPEIDFGEYLIQCEDVCFYEQLELDLK